MLDPHGAFISREIPLDPATSLLMYTDGLSEARDGDQLFGEERIANTIRRDPGRRIPACCASRCSKRRSDFATSPITDDIAILALRRA